MPRNLKLSAALIATFVAVIAVVVLVSRGGDDERSATRTTTTNAGGAGGGQAAAPPVVASDPRRLGRRGSTNVTFTEFLDFECEACGAAYPVVEQLRQEYAGRVTFNIRYFPLPSHLNSRPAAQAVEAAYRQGKLEDMYNRMYQTQPTWGDQQTAKAFLFRSFAQNINLDMKKFDRDVKDPRVAQRVQRDVSAGEALGVNSTPTFFINEKKIEPQSFEDLRGLLDNALRGT